MRELLRRVRYWLRRGRLDADLAEELEHHRRLKARELERRGLDPAEAAVEARRALGNALVARERSRDVWISPWLQDAGQDLRFAGRILLRNRWFTLAAATALALGIGVNATVFTIINAMTFRDLPVDHPEQILSVQTRDTLGRTQNVSYLDFRDWQRTTRTFAGLAAVNGATINIGDDSRAPDQHEGAFVTANAFQLLRVRPILGRDFVSDDDRPGAHPVVILGHSIWTGRYAADPLIIGRTIRVNAAPVTVIGVMPEGFKFPFQADLWQPLAARPDVTTQTREVRGIAVFGRLADGIGTRQARTELATIANRLAQQYPDTNTGIEPIVMTFNERYNGRITDGIPLVLMGAVGFVLLIACANVSNLLLARSAHRAREIAIRTSLGATRWRIVRQVLIESVLLALAAGALGIWVAVLGVRLFTSAVDDLMMPYWVRFTFDARVVAFLAAVSLGTAILFGLAPALHMSKTNVNEAIKDGGGGRSGVGGRIARRWTSALLVPELALTLILLAGAGFLIRGSLTLYRADLVIDPSNLLTMRLSLPQQKYSTPELRETFGRRLEERLAAIQPISVATIASALPFAGAARQQLSIEGLDEPAGDRRPAILTVAIGSRYFETLDLRLPRGRMFAATDGAPGREAAIVNERFVAVHLPNEDPIGKRIRLMEETPSGAARPAEAIREGQPWLTIVGVAPTIRQRPFGEAEPVVYLPYRARPGAFAALIVRARGEPAAIAALVREEVRALDPDLPLYGVMTMAQLSDMSRWTHRIVSTMLSIFACIAMVLSATGLYAVIAYAVTQRTQEIGVRMALGAQPFQVMWLFARRALAPLGLGVAIGLGGALAVGQVLRSAFIEASGTDPLTLITVATLLVAVAAAACILPARRAARLDPVTALRYE